MLNKVLCVQWCLEQFSLWLGSKGHFISKIMWPNGYIYWSPSLLTPHYLCDGANQYHPESQQIIDYFQTCICP